MQIFYVLFAGQTCTMTPAKLAELHLDPEPLDKFAAIKCKSFQSKPGGLLLLDNSVRPQYRKARRLFDVSPNWTSVEFSWAGQGKALDELASVLWCRLR